MSLSRNGSELGAFCRRMCARMDKPRANTAVAHKLAPMIYFTRTRGESYVDQGKPHYEEQRRANPLPRSSAAPPASDLDCAADWPPP